MEHTIVIMDFRKMSVNIYKAFISEGQDIDEFIYSEYHDDVIYMIDPVQINIEL